MEQYTIIGKLTDRTEPLHTRITEFNEMYSKEIGRFELFALLSDSHTVEITVKKCYDYLSGKVLAGQYLDAFMQNKDYTII